MKKKKSKSNNFIKNIIHKLLVLAVVIILILILDIGCIFKSLTGFPCLGCGTTRACISFLHGRWLEAFYWQPLFWLTVPLLLVVVAKGENIFKSKRANIIFIIILAIIYLGTYAVRMYLLFPDIAPMDYNYDAPLYQVFIKIKSLIN